MVRMWSNSRYVSKRVKKFYYTICKCTTGHHQQKVITKHQSNNIDNNDIQIVKFYQTRKLAVQHLSIYGIYIALLQGNYSEALPAQARAKIKVLRSL